MLSADVYDPDAGRRALQCACGASRRHTTTAEAQREGWGTTWIRERRVWACPDCYVAPPPALAEARFPPHASARFLALSRSAKGRATCFEVLDRLLDMDPAYAWRWYLEAMISARRATRDAFERWALSRGLWDQETMIAQHRSKSNEHYTPPWIASLARETFGGPIHLDPASCEAANRLIGAERYFAEQDDGLSLPWEGNVFLNPPGKRRRLGNEDVSQAAFWWASLAVRFADGHGPIPHAVFLIFNLELLRHAQAWPVRQPLTFPTLIFRHRVRYFRPGPIGQDPVEGDCPTHPSALVYLGPERERFCHLAKPLGVIVGQ